MRSTGVVKEEAIPRQGHVDVFAFDIVPEEDDVNKIPIPKQAKNALGPHIYNRDRNDRGLVIGYQKITVTQYPEYPKTLRREATKAEIKQREADLTLEMWLDRDFDLIKETGLNQLKRQSAWVKWMNRPVEVTVATREEEEAKVAAV